ncbi:MAG: ATP-binding protein [Spirochaetaceae bacterium]|nr:ATP-binding protein [Spirochaetaceae bacterium]
MPYIQRHAKQTLMKMLSQFKVVLVTGPRQVGKSTLLQNELKNFEYVTLDDMAELEQARSDPALFFKNHSLPVVIDEVQYAPELFRYIKFLVDKSDAKGQICLTGSQTYSLMQNVSESLAGRIGILELQGLSLREKQKVNFFEPFVPNSDYIQNRLENLVQYNGIWNDIFYGSMPEMTNKEIDWNFFYRSYVKSYIERDVRNLMNIKDESLFYKFMVALAARTGCLFNAADIANSTGVSLKTIQSWISVLEASGIIFFLRPYENNILKRTVKTPKIYFNDTGLVCYLVGWDNPKVAQNGAMAGELFETFVISEIAKTYFNSGADLRSLFFYRDSNQKEIDLLISKNGSLFPVEIKKSAQVSISMAKNFPAVKLLNEIQTGTILCQCDKKMFLSETVQALPLEFV